jgi:hypothetical protein
MKPLLLAALAMLVATSLRAQAPGPAYAPEQLDQLVAPIALYPDPLVALMLPAAAVPADISKAAQYLAANGDPAAIDSQPWDPSVRGLAHYPEVLNWMNANPDWTGALGAAFAMQPSDVMKSVQQMRARAKAAGSLVDTPQQQVDMDGDDIRIIPAQPDEIYVPAYDPDAVYDVQDADTGPLVTFGVGYPVGAWLGFECDWDDFGIWFGPWQPGWGYRRDWVNASWGGRRWHADPARGHALVRSYYRPGGNLPSPRVMAGARLPARGSVARPAEAPAQSRPDYRGYGSGALARPSTPAPASPLFGGYGRGTQARDYSNRGHTSRQAPVRPSAPARSQAPRSEPAPSGGRDRR